jgi:hypothetical protein
MKKNRYTLLLIDFIPIILVFIFITQPKEAILFSNTILGKMIAISIILFYSNINIVYGFFVCVVIMFYYQSDLVENTLNTKMDNLEHLIHLNNQLMLIGKEYKEYFSPQNGEIDPHTTSAENIISPQLAPSPSPEVQLEEGPASIPYRAFEPELYSYDPYVPHNEQNEDILNGVDKKSQLKEIFRKQYCVNGKLEMKGEKVKTEMATHVFRELDSVGLNCNPCDENCDFSIIEERLKNEEELMKPKDSNMWYDTIMASINESNNMIMEKVGDFIPGWNS